MGVPPSIRCFFHQIQGFPQFQLPLAMLWKREPTRIWREKSDRKTFTIICEVKLNDNWWHDLSTTRYRVPFLKGIRGGMAKGANLMPCQTNQLYHSKFPFLFDIRVCVSGFITAVQMIRNVFSEQVFYGTSAAWCLYRPDTPHSFLTFRRNDQGNVIGNWGETWGMKFDTKYSCKMSQVTYTVTQSIVSAGALLTRRQKMFC